MVIIFTLSSQALLLSWQCILSSDFYSLFTVHVFWHKIVWSGTEQTLHTTAPFKLTKSIVVKPRVSQPTLSLFQFAFYSMCWPAQITAVGWRYCSVATILQFTKHRLQAASQGHRLWATALRSTHTLHLIASTELNKRLSNTSSALTFDIANNATNQPNTCGNQTIYGHDDRHDIQPSLQFQDYTLSLFSMAHFMMKQCRI